MTKMIKIESCGGCPYLLGIDYCPIEDKHVDIKESDPDCSLDDFELAAIEYFREMQD